MAVAVYKKNLGITTDNISESSMPNCSAENETPFLLKYGPIIIRPRQRPAPTIATGRRSKTVQLSPNETVRRDIRRVHNRAAQAKAAIKRQHIEDTLKVHIELLEKQSDYLVRDINALESQKSHLITLLAAHELTCEKHKTILEFEKYLNNCDQSDFMDLHFFRTHDYLTLDDLRNNIWNFIISSTDGSHMDTLDNF
ncbi:unnamed protein product [Didymodactylos carnosus]|uniref:BZIP domain-containing protein n=1 Tax=Didymodactylos carnosus TaxID=1234261 RepID=A0A814SGC2_9BILA|nr:unnamed protein product [Didymodactylos carnosus]CAF1145668.1 unnamed protein product [Didymodactylos carnosus]CAF3711388.1 unnamed protein product [Didymodactylos carnosus]CAF3909277.1 unnamed protein product [Didymodactylos carnosus]